jgi:hypothetical protein
MKSLFKSKIKCSHCGNSYLGKLEKGKRKYICMSYHKNSSTCVRIPIFEEFLVQVIERRFGMELSYEEIQENVLLIEIEDKLLFTIHIKDQEPIIYGRNHIVY